MALKGYGVILYIYDQLLMIAWARKTISISAPAFNQKGEVIFLKPWGYATRTFLKSCCAGLYYCDINLNRRSL